MHEGERGGDDIVVYLAKDEDDLRWWQLEQVCRCIHEPDPPAQKIWRFYRDHAEDGKWMYTERKNYDYNAIEDPRLYGFECFLRVLRYGFPPDRWEGNVQEHIALMNYWYQKPHWDYDTIFSRMKKPAAGSLAAGFLLSAYCFIVIPLYRERRRGIPPASGRRP